MFFKKLYHRVPKSIWALGLVSLLMDTSSEMVHGILPVFLVSALGASYSTVGFIEGSGESISLILKVFSGPLSDWLQKRKPLVILGYSMGALSKPFFAIATSPTMVLAARLFDRTGKGIRGAPRDALIADITPKEIRGEAFGLRQSLDTIGAFLGPLIAILLMYLSGGNYRLILWVAIIPGLLCVATLFFGVQEPENHNVTNGKKLVFNAVKSLGVQFWMVAIAGTIFQLARFNEAFLILRTQEVGLKTNLIPAVLVVMNVVYAIFAYPIGWISDHVRREWMLLIGFLILTLADLVFAHTRSLELTAVGISLWGLHLGFTEGILSALVADTCEPQYRGTAFGMFNLLSAGSLFVASSLAGYLWDTKGSAATFTASAYISIIGIFVLLLSKKFWSTTKPLQSN